MEWLKDGDKNSAFFHKILKGRIHKNRILSICDDQGNKYDDDKVAEQFVHHFQEFLGTSEEISDITEPETLFVNKIPENEAENMIREIADVEIKEALFDIGDNKAPGPDGYTAKFFKEGWSVIGKDVCKAIKKFFPGCDLPKGVNATTISLVPKVNTPGKMSEYRPIACCTVLYKCISKILTNRIKGVLGKLVNANQSAFIPGRNISDNITVTQELVRGYNRKYGLKRCAMKIDLQKAYDTIRWRFVE